MSLEEDPLAGGIRAILVPAPSRLPTGPSFVDVGGQGRPGQVVPAGSAPAPNTARWVGQAPEPDEMSADRGWRSGFDVAHDPGHVVGDPRVHARGVLGGAVRRTEGHDAVLHDAQAVLELAGRGQRAAAVAIARVLARLPRAQLAVGRDGQLQWHVGARALVAPGHGHAHLEQRLAAARCKQRLGSGSGAG